MATYDGRLKGVRDTDLFFWDGAGATWTYGPTMSSTISSVSDILDLGSDQVFINHPAVIMFETTGATVSCLSIHSSGLTASKCAVPGFWLQDAADGSTFSAIGFVKMPGDASLDCTATLFNDMTLGVVKCRRYLRLFQQMGVGVDGTVRAWLRLGLTA
ncbi:MAG: hypothetical protein PHD37_17220 [Gallionellaceae bacterium]|nr:hypothetical protein [Gallionellaceae bacterium]